MQRKLLLPAFVLITFATLLLSCASVSPAWAASKYKVLHNFTGGSDGGVLWGSLLLDAHGNLYGTTGYGGPYEGGTAFEVTPQTVGDWKLTVLYSFCKMPPHCEDGGGPHAGMIFDAAGNLYGTAVDGGRGRPVAAGTAFELTPSGHKWKGKTIYNFHLPGGESAGWGGLVMDSSGNLYGVSGAAYKLSTGPKGWKATVLHRFSKRNDGYEPFAGLIMDSSGNLYGTTYYGGGSKGCGGGGCGIVFELSPTAGGKWKEHILHRFQGSDGDGPGFGALAMDASGNLYGTTEGGGTGQGQCGGVVYELSPQANGKWQETVLYSFGEGAGGCDPVGGVALDGSGNLFGTGNAGGAYGSGVVYKLTPGPKGKWAYTVLHSFNGNDGYGPTANPILDEKGNIYGTTAYGGSGNYGVAFELSP
jgi:uncharacterized repeat protein (TIGR03803 family)